jgi:hypothetical protein
LTIALTLKIYCDTLILPIAVAHWIKPVRIRLSGAHQWFRRRHWRAFGEIVWRFDMGGATARHFVDPDYWDTSDTALRFESRESLPKLLAFPRAVRR